MANTETITVNLKKSYLIIMIVVATITFITPAISAFISIGTNSNDIGKLDTRVCVLEDNHYTNHDLLLELKFNIKKSMGDEYVELIPTIVKGKK